MNKNEQFFPSSRNLPNRLIWVGIDLTSVPAKFGGPGTSGTVTRAWLHFRPCLALTKYPGFWSQNWDSDLGPLECVPATLCLVGTMWRGPDVW